MSWKQAVKDILKVGSVALSAINPLAASIVSAVETIWPDGNGDVKSAISQDVVRRIVDILQNANVISPSAAKILTENASEYVEVIFQKLTEDGMINSGKGKSFDGKLPSAFVSPASVTYDRPAKVVIEY